MRGWPCPPARPAAWPLAPDKVHRYTLTVTGPDGARQGSVDREYADLTLGMRTGADREWSSTCTPAARSSATRVPTS
jgi:hypothetical protein